MRISYNMFAKLHAGSWEECDIELYARARRKLEAGKAVIASYEPFAIRLAYQIHNPDLDGLTL